MYFEIIGEITNVEIIAVGSAIREIARLRKHYGTGRWRKLKGIATVRLSNGKTRQAKICWYEAHGIGKKRLKIKRFLDWKTWNSVNQNYDLRFVFEMKDVKTWSK